MLAVVHRQRKKRTGNFGQWAELTFDIGEVSDVLESVVSAEAALEVVESCRGRS